MRTSRLRPSPTPSYELPQEEVRAYEPAQTEEEAEVEETRCALCFDRAGKGGHKGLGGHCWRDGDSIGN